MQKPLTLLFRLRSVNHEEFEQEQHRHHIGQQRHLLEPAGKYADRGVKDDAKPDSMTDRPRYRHGEQHDAGGSKILHLIKLHIFQPHQHQDPHIDERTAGGRRRNDRRDGGKEGAQQEQNARNKRRHARASARLDTRHTFGIGGHRAGAQARARHRADGIGKQSLLHFRHVALFIHHTGTAGRSHKYADCIKHIDHTFTGVISTMTLRPENMRKAAGEGFINATDLADYLVRKGLPFRSAYKISGQLVAQCMQQGLTLETVPLDMYKNACDLIEADIYDAVNLDQCVATRISFGGTGPKAVEEQLKWVQEQLKRKE